MATKSRLKKRKKGKGRALQLKQGAWQNGWCPFWPPAKAEVWLTPRKSPLHNTLGKPVNWTNSPKTTHQPMDAEHMLALRTRNLWAHLWARMPKICPWIMVSRQSSKSKKWEDTWEAKIGPKHDQGFPSDSFPTYLRNEMIARINPGANHDVIWRDQNPMAWVCWLRMKALPILAW